MKPLKHVTLAGSLLVACAAPPPASRTQTPPEIESMMSNYVDLWSRGDVARIVQEAYTVPFTIIRADGSTTYEDESTLTSFLTDTFAQLRSRGYARSRLNGYEVCRVHGDVAVVEMNFTRLQQDGAVMGSPERAATYVLRKTPAGFRIAGLVLHTDVAK